MVGKRNTKFLVLVGLVALLVAVAAILAFAAANRYSEDYSDGPTPNDSYYSNQNRNQADQPGEEQPGESSGQLVSLEGTYECLPKAGSGPQTMECAFGLATGDGKHYGLDMTGMPDDSGNGILDYSIGDRLRVTGNLQEAENTTYDSEFTIKVQTISPMD